MGLVLGRDTYLRDTMCAGLKPYEKNYPATAALRFKSHERQTQRL